MLDGIPVSFDLWTQASLNITQISQPGLLYIPVQLSLLSETIRRRMERSVYTTANWVLNVIGVALPKVRTRGIRKAKYELWEGQFD